MLFTTTCYLRRFRAYSRDLDVFIIWHEVLVRIPTGIDHAKTNVPDIYPSADTVGRIDVPVCYFDHDALKGQKRVIEITGYKRQTDETEKRKEILNFPWSDPSYRIRVTRHRRKSPSFFVNLARASRNKP